MSPERPLSLYATVERDPEQVSADLDGELVLVSIANGKYYNMNAVGSRIWALLSQPIAVAALIDLLVAEFDVERPLCETEVLEFLGELRADGLVRVSE